MTELVPDPVELLQALIRFDTTNPPGNEAPCIAYVQELLERAGCETEIVAADPARPNLIARLPGAGTGLPLLLYGHVDVVTTAGQAWSRPPFAGDVVDGMVWGRGALDMKSGVAMIVSAFLRTKTEGPTPPGGLVLAVLSDEEAGGDVGARFLVEQHPDRFAGIRHALGEFGAFTMHVAGRRFYPIQVAEKQICWLKATVRGRGGHGALPMRGGTMARLSAVLDALDRRRMPIHLTPVTQQMVETMAASVPRPHALVLRRLLDPRTSDATLRLLGRAGRLIEPMLRNTANATIVRGGEKINVIPSEVELEIDGRLLPGFTPSDLISELQEIVGQDVELELVRHDPGPGEPDLTLFDMLSRIVRELDPEGIAMPLLQPGVTDGRYFSRLGIQTYGFLPLNLPPEFELTALVHAADERVPADAVRFGAEGVWRAVQAYNV